MPKSLIYRLPLLLAVGLFASMPAYAGGGGWFIKPLGLMLGGAMLLTILLIKLKQTNILSFVIMGYVMASVAGTSGNIAGPAGSALQRYKGHTIWLSANWFSFDSFHGWPAIQPGRHN